MLNIHDQDYRLCDGLTRRELLRVGSLGALGLSATALLSGRAAASTAPAGPGAGRAFARLLVFRDDLLTDPYYAFRLGEDGAAEHLDAALSGLDAALGGRPFLGGAEFGLADIAYVPWLLRARDKLGVELDGLPHLAGWLARLEERPSIAAEAGIVAAL